MQAPLSKVAFAVLHVGLAAAFLVSGSAKLAYPGSYTQLFHLNQYPRWFTYVIGATEVVAALGLLFSRTRAYAAYALIPIMAGAVWTKTHVEPDDAASLIELPVVLLVLLAVVLVESFPWDGSRPRRPGGTVLQLPRQRRRTAPPR
jgi:uncharacterized membrane protein YphA (DoxX/SURF4 family)